MKKRFHCEVDCASCAQKLEDALGKLEGVEKVSVNFLTQRLTLTAADEHFDEVFAAVAAKAKQLEPDTVIEA